MTTPHADASAATSSEVGETPQPAASADVGAEPTSSLFATLWHRIHHHNVMHWTLAYAAAAYTLLHGVEMISGALNWPHTIVRVLTLVLILGVPVTILLAWYHGHKAQHRVSGPELAMLAVLLFIAGTLLWALSGTQAEHTEKTVTTSAITDTASDKPTTPVASRTAVAVLPFANLTGDASKDYLGDGMAEELINTLTKVQGLKVPARTSTFAYKGRNTDIRQIAKDLGVGTILEGSVRAAGKRIRITAQLINAQDGLHLWSETYDEEFTDIFKLQDKLATEIATALQPNLLAVAEAAVTQGPPTRDVEAYNLYLQGVSLVQRPGEQTAAKAIDYFQQALARDPKFARAYAMIAEAHITWSTALNAPSDHMAAAERAARQALALDPNLAIGHLALAVISGTRQQVLEMEVHRRAGVSLAPNDGDIRATSAMLLSGVGHLKQALEEAGRAYALAPANPVGVAFLAYLHAEAGHDLEAAKYADAAVDLGYPKENFLLQATYELIALRSKRYADAADFATRAFDVREPDQARVAEVVRLVYAALADSSQRKAALSARARLYPTSGTAAAAGAAHADTALCIKSSYYYALMAANDVAYGLYNECLDRWVPGETSVGNGIVTWFIPELRAFRRDPRFQALETRIGAMEVWQQYGLPDDCDLKGGKLTCR